jgi:hypothetical protein
MHNICEGHHSLIIPNVKGPRQADLAPFLTNLPARLVKAGLIDVGQKQASPLSGHSDCGGPAYSTGGACYEYFSFVYLHGFSLTIHVPHAGHVSHPGPWI